MSQHHLQEDQQPFEKDLRFLQCKQVHLGYKRPETVDGGDNRARAVKGPTDPAVPVLEHLLPR